MSLRLPRDEVELWLIAYDISDDKRRVRVAKQLSRVGVRIQYSVFEVEINPVELEKLASMLSRIINFDEDRIDLVNICARCISKWRRIGTKRDFDSEWIVL